MNMDPNDFYHHPATLRDILGCLAIVAALITVAFLAERRRWRIVSAIFAYYASSVMLLFAYGTVQFGFVLRWRLVDFREGSSPWANWIVAGVIVFLVVALWWHLVQVWRGKRELALARR